MKDLTDAELYEYLVAQALCNPVLCNGAMSEIEIRSHFGRNASNITKADIAVTQATLIAKEALSKLRK